MRSDRNHSFHRASAVIITAIALFSIPLLSTAKTLTKAAKNEYAPSETSVTQTKNKTATVSLSFTLFQKLKDMSTDGVLQYLKQRGCKITYSSEVFYTKVSGGIITIYPPTISYPRIGVGPVEFTTDNPNVRNAWYRGLRNAGYYVKDGFWNKNGSPTYGVADYLGAGEGGEDYAGGCTLYVMQYEEDLNLY